ncbi:MAG TPA: APC family permease [Candidatus Acidoferrum sp.]|nr:APC family permease [Candidatus Acidoferrum sp.]
MSTTLEASSSAGTDRPSRGRLLKVLGMWFGIAAAIGNTIAAGIVAGQGYIAALLPNVWLFLGVWILGGIYALCGASSLAELGAAIPRSGGQYNYSRRALGEYAGFIVGWSDWISTCGTNAVVALVIGNYIGVLLPSLAGRDATMAVAILFAFALLQWRGIKWGSAAQLLTAALKTGAFLVLVIACFLLGGPSHQAAATSTVAPGLPTGWLLAAAFMMALQKVIYTVDGWDGVIYFGEEVKDPGRDVPRAIFGSVFSIIAIYVLLSAAVAYVLPMNEIIGNGFALGTAATRIFGSYGDPVIRSIMLISLLSCINACQLFSTRTLYAMSSDGLFFRAASRVNPGGTPVLALVLSTAVGMAFCIFQQFIRVIDMLAFFFVANYTLSFISTLRLRAKEPGLLRPYRAWGYPWTTGIALAASVLFLAGALYTDRVNTPWAFGILVASYPIFRVVKFLSNRVAVT